MTHDDYVRKAGAFMAQMEKVSTFLGLKLSHHIFSETKHLSITLQGKDTTIQEAITASELAVNYLERLKLDSSFDEFYTQVVETSKQFTYSPTLPRYRTAPRKLGEVGATSHKFITPQSYFRM